MTRPALIVCALAVIAVVPAVSYWSDSDAPSGDEARPIPDPALLELRSYHATQQMISDLEDMSRRLRDTQDIGLTEPADQENEEVVQ